MLASCPAWFMDLEEECLLPTHLQLCVKLNSQGVHNISHNLARKNSFWQEKSDSPTSQTSFIGWKFKCRGRRPPSILDPWGREPQ